MNSKEVKWTRTAEERVVAGHTLRRIRAVRDIPSKGVKAGDLGGWVEFAFQLTQVGDAWIGGDAMVYGRQTKVVEDAHVYGNAVVSGEARVTGSAHVFDNARIHGPEQRDLSESPPYIGDRAQVYGDAEVSGDSTISGSAHVYGHAKVTDAMVTDDAMVFDHAQVLGHAEVSGRAMVSGDARVMNAAIVTGDTRVHTGDIRPDQGPAYVPVILALWRADDFDEVARMIQDDPRVSAVYRQAN